MSISDRIKKRLHDLSMKQTDLVKEMGVSKGSVSQWINGNAKPDRNIVQLASVLQCSPEWLMTGEGSSDFIGSKIPVLSPEEAHLWLKGDLPISSIEFWREPGEKLSLNSFALKVSDDSMTSFQGGVSIPPGSIAIVEPEAEPVKNNIIVAQIKGAAEVVIKKLATDGLYTYLMPLNQAYKAIELSDDCNIIGVVKRIEIDL
ncbi:helix-turn-helix domain-containing protein [Endozoicomonas sp. SM1973]|uniref:Helix-turn-helix domain-containing protein n=1 Tax=Spartinivicinus marinus TaxID=2994442 RepID=A0A853I610_9GAMM|nr:S24 family peptidase [Spartinivicinus marinus]NYZ69350.1 helix-turn-helix domain-containing protein [Spartinivicinus marinus]